MFPATQSTFRFLTSFTPAIYSFIGALCLTASLATSGLNAAEDYVVYEGSAGPGQGKHIVFLAGDEEYRSEECLPQLAKILAARHGFKCTVLFSIDESTGDINPQNGKSLSHPEAIDTADAFVMLLRFRQWPDETMARFIKAVEAGKPVIALRTSTHAFNYGGNSDSPFAKYGWNYSKAPEWKGGFGKQILGETWVAHHGHHKVEGTRGIIEPSQAEHPILRGVKDVFGDTDVYTANPPADATILMRGEVTKTLEPDSPAVEGKKNNPMQPIAWTRDHKHETGATSRIFTTTMGSATDIQNEGVRRMIINAVYWGLGQEAAINPSSNVAFVGEFVPTMYGFGSYKKGIKPADLKMSPAELQQAASR